MKYWLFTGRGILGPYAPLELAEKAPFSTRTLVCPEDRQRDRTEEWRPAAAVDELIEPLQLARRAGPRGALGPPDRSGPSALTTLIQYGSVLDQVAELADTVERLKEDIRRRETALHDLRMKAAPQDLGDDRLLTDAAVIEGALQEIPPLRASLERAREEKLRADAETEAERTRAAGLQDEVARVKSDEDAAEMKSERLAEDISHLKEKISHLTQDSSELKVELDKRDDALERSRDEATRGALANAALRAHAATLQSQIAEERTGRQRLEEAKNRELAELDEKLRRSRKLTKGLSAASAVLLGVAFVAFLSRRAPAPPILPPPVPRHAAAPAPPSPIVEQAPPAPIAAPVLPEPGGPTTPAAAPRRAARKAPARAVAKPKPVPEDADPTLTKAQVEELLREALPELTPEGQAEKKPRETPRERAWAYP